MNVFSMLSEYLSFDFVWYAIIACVLTALCSSLLGVTLVLKRYSFIGDGLSHVAFGAMAVAAVMSVSDEMLIVLPVTIVCAVFLLRRGSFGVRGDAALAMLSVGAMAAGYLLLNVFSTSANVSGDVCSTLFGSSSILTLKDSDVILCAVISLVTAGAFVLLYNKIFAVTFDESFARASGTNTGLINLLTAVITAVVIVLSMKLVGALLTSALIVFPALSSMKLFDSFRGVTVCSAVVAVTAALAGIIVSVLCATPAGATVVAANMIIFFICSAVRKIKC